MACNITTIPLQPTINTIYKTIIVIATICQIQYHYLHILKDYSNSSCRQSRRMLVILYITSRIAIMIAITVIVYILVRIEYYRSRVKRKRMCCILIITLILIIGIKVIVVMVRMVMRMQLRSISEIDNKSSNNDNILLIQYKNILYNIFFIKLLQ